MYNYELIRGNFMIEFGEWLKTTLKERGWTQGELSRRAQVSRSAVSNIIAKRRLPSPETAVQIANALNMPPETVMRQAGYLPDVEADSATTRQIMEFARRMSEKNRKEILEYMRFRLNEEKTKDSK